MIKNKVDSVRKEVLQDCLSRINSGNLEEREYENKWANETLERRQMQFKMMCGLFISL